MRTLALLTATLACTAALAARPAPVGEQALKRSGAVLAHMRRSVREAQLEQEEARRAKDLAKATCMDETLPALRVLLTVTEEADAALRGAAALGDGVAVEHALAKVTLASGRLTGLRTELERCLGQLAYRTEPGVQVELEGSGKGGPEAPEHAP